jgi:hypothetical protein
VRLLVGAQLEVVQAGLPRPGGSVDDRGAVEAGDDRKGVDIVDRRIWNVSTTAMTLLLLLLSPAILWGKQAARPGPAERDVVYGMFSGLALLMDVHRPERPNGLGIVAIIGTAWTTRSGYAARPMKESQQQLPIFVTPLVAAG